MTRHARHALPGFDPSAVPSRETGGTARSGKAAGEAGMTGSWASVPWPEAAPLPPPPALAVRAEPATATGAAGAPGAHAAPRRARGTGVGTITYLIVLCCTVAGVYIAWRQGSQGGGRGGVVAGSALLLAAVLRLVLPGKLVGLLASRRWLTDVLTLTVLGVGLLVVGLVLPR